MTTTRLDNLRERLEEQGLDYLLVSQAENRRYLSGFTGSAGFLLVGASSAVLATDFRYIEQAAHEAPAFDIFRMEGQLTRWFPVLASGLGRARLGFNSQNLLYASFLELRQAVSEFPIDLVPTKGLVAALRAVKDAQELECIIRAVALGDEALAFALDRLEPGWTELRLAWELERYMREHGSGAIPFDIIVAAGPRSSLPHAQPTDRAIGAGEPIVIDMGARIGGYCSDMTRSICLGPPDDTFKRIFDLVLAAQLIAEATVEVGMTGEQADALARRVIQEGGHGDHFGHGLGHGVGLEIHEPPRLGPRSEDVLADGTVFTIEPGIYLPEWGGIRIEDMVVMQEGRPQVLTGSPKTQDGRRRSL